VALLDLHGAVSSGGEAQWQPWLGFARAGERGHGDEDGEDREGEEHRGSLIHLAGKLGRDGNGRGGATVVSRSLQRREVEDDPIFSQNPLALFSSSQIGPSLLFSFSVLKTRTHTVHFLGP
jgi:hypothetical protein